MDGWEVTSERSGLTSQHPEVTSQSPEVSSQRPEVTSQRPELTFQRPEVTSPCPEVSSYRPELTSSGLELTSEPLGPHFQCLVTSEKTGHPSVGAPLVGALPEGGHKGRPYMKRYPHSDCDAVLDGR